MSDGDSQMEDVTTLEFDDWDDHWRASNKEFELMLPKDEVLQTFCGKMFFVWEGNHKVFEW